jgi:type I restriction enzyme S subunit
MSAIAAERGDASEAGEPWLLPEGWAWARLGELGKWTGGGTPSKSVESYWQNGTIPWVSPKDMKFAVIRETEDRITADAVEASTTKCVAPGSVLMVTRSGILRHTFPVAVNAERVTLNQDLRALTPAIALDPYFLAHYLRSIQRQILHDCSKDGTTVQSIDAAPLEKVWVPIAPMLEQRRIVARIHELFAEIAEGEVALERARAPLSTWGRALLKAAVTGDLTRDWREANTPAGAGVDLLNCIGMKRKDGRFATGRRRRESNIERFDTSAFPKLPSGWVWCRLEDIITQGPTNGYSPKASNDDTGSFSLKLTATTAGSIDLSERAVKRLTETIQLGSSLFLKPGDILFQRGNTIEYVGLAAVAR